MSFRWNSSDEMAPTWASLCKGDILVRREGALVILILERSRTRKGHVSLRLTTGKVVNVRNDEANISSTWELIRSPRRLIE